MDKVERSWGLRAPRDDRNKFRSTLRWTWASRATRQTWTGVNVSDCARGSPCGAGVSVTLPYAGGRRVDPARRACPISARASARCGARRWNALAIQARVNVSENRYNPRRSVTSVLIRVLFPIRLDVSPRRCMPQTAPGSGAPAVRRGSGGGGSQRACANGRRSDRRRL